MLSTVKTNQVTAEATRCGYATADSVIAPRSIIKFQALFRGYMVRKKYPNLAVKGGRAGGHFSGGEGERGPDMGKKGERYF